ncbi:hypothetical protein BJ912DRAFT_636297 [Pholiota molesta]|nr:hypothetical protein BJ912DRAFT_636297 [Pholiota molesta]
MAPASAHSDGQESDEDEDGGMHMQHDGGHREKSKAQHATSPSMSTSDAAERAEEEYLGARYRLTQLAQTIKNRLVHPDCCCGYTLDQAVVHEAEVRRWQAALPASVKWVDHVSVATPTLVPATASAPGSYPDAHFNTAATPPFAQKPAASSSEAGMAERVQLLQRSELAVMANVLLIKVYTPFLRRAASAGGGPNGTGHDAAVPISSAAAQTTVHAAHAILKAAKEIYGAQSSSSSSSQSLLSTSLLSISLSSSPTSSSSPSASPGKTAVPAPNSSQRVTAAAAVSPSMFDLYPLDKLVFDAVVICAHAAQLTAGKAMSSSLSPLPFAALDGAALLDDVAIALGWLLGEHPEGSGVVGVALGDDKRKIAAALCKRVGCRVGANQGMKRKHSQVELCSPFGAISTGYQSSNPLPGHEWNSVNATQVGQYQQRHANVVALHSSSPSASRSSVPPANFPHDEFIRTEHQKQEMTSVVRLAVAVRDTEQGDGEKEKKHAKKDKNPTYPSVGVRVRANKDRDNSSRASRQHSFSGASGGGNPQPLMTSAARALPAPDAVLAYQKQQKQKLSMQPAAPPTTSNSQSPYEQDLNRSRSSSLSHVQSEHAHQHQRQQQEQHLQQQSLSQSQSLDGSPENLRYPFFEAPPSEVANTHMVHRKHFSIHEHQPQQQSVSSERPPFTPNVYDQTQAHSQVMYEPQTYDSMQTASSTGAEGRGYSTVSSPFSNAGAPTSSSSSPFTTTSVVSSGHPSTPTFPQHHPTAPVFGPQPPAPTSSATAYFHTSTAFTEPSYPGPSASSSHLSHQQQHDSHQGIPLSGMNMDQTIISIPSAPQSYEKQPQHHEVTMYDMKSGVEHHQLAHQQQQMRQHQPMDASYDEHDMPGQNHAMAMGMPSPDTWSTMGQRVQQQQQQPQQPQHPSPSNPQPFWNNGAEYRFYS